MVETSERDVDSDVDESELLEELGIEGDLSPYDLIGLDPEGRQRLAAKLMEGWNDGDPSENLQIFAETIPEALHPYLDEIDADEEAADVDITWLAFLGAPAAALKDYEWTLETAARQLKSLSLDEGVVLRVDASDEDPSVTSSVRVLVASENAIGWGAVERLLAVAESPVRESLIQTIRDVGYDVSERGGLERPYAPIAYELFPKDEEDEADVVGRMWGAADAACGRCGVRLWRVLDISPAAVLGALPVSFAEERLQIVTCRHCCRDLGPDYFIFSHTLTTLLTPTLMADSWMDPHRHTAPQFVAPNEIPVWLAAAARHGGLADRVGGSPDRSQQRGNRVRCPYCPCCGKQMPFLARFEEPDEREFSEEDGFLAAFLCAPCRVVGTRIARG